MIVKAFFNNALKHQDRVAVVAGEEQLSYAQLYQQSKVVADNLIRLGIKRGDVIAICSDRGVNTIVSMLATMLAGAAYTVVEQTQSTAELLKHLSDIQPDYTIIAHAEASSLSETIEAYTVEQLLNATGKHVDLPELSSNDIAYVLFTSGSTGKPKGVKVSHGNIHHYSQSISALTEVKAPLNFGHLSTLAADLGNTSLFLSLYHGGCLHLIDQYTRKDPRKLITYLREQDIDFIKITPSHWSAVIQSFTNQTEILPSLEYIIFGGEPLQKRTARDVLENQIAKRVFNHYGPTEATVGVSAIELTSIEHINSFSDDVIPIGSPFGDTCFFVKCDDGKFKSSNVRGELLIAGPSVAQGYRNRVEETSARFINIETQTGTVRCYKTGDYVSLDESGMASFIGRIDRQVKINGYRVELESIENTLKEQLSVSAASVAYLQHENKNWLLAAITTPAKPCDDIKAMLSEAMPAHTIPQRFYVLDKMPRNENGKTDNKAIQALLKAKLVEDLTSNIDSHGAEKNQYSGENLKLFQSISPIFYKHIAPQRCGVHENFFELGGNSLDSVQLVADLQYKGFAITAFDFNNMPTIDGIISSVISNRERQEKSKNATKKTSSDVFAAAQDFFFKENLANPDLYNQSVIFKVEADLEPELLKTAITKICEQHELLKTAFSQNENGGYSAKTLPLAIDSVFSHSMISLDDEEAITEQAKLIQSAIHLESGAVFKAHLFSTGEGISYLLLVAHHICVDVISWRIITNEVTQIYCDLKDGVAIADSAVQSGFWDWVDHIQGEVVTRENIETKLASSAHSTPLIDKVIHTESEAKTDWLVFSKQHSDELESIAAAQHVPLHLLFLGALFQTCGRLQDTEQVCIDIESHGRVSFDPQLDISRTVGWHTSTFPLNVSVNKQLFEQTLRNTKASFDAVADLGVHRSWQIHHHQHADALYQSPICFNFLGDTDFPHDDRLKLTPCTIDIGTCRGASNLRFHEIKVSIQKMLGQYVVDISYPGNANQQQQRQISSFLDNYRALLTGLLVDSSTVKPSITTSGTSTGAIHYCPEKLSESLVTEQPRDYKEVILTGATGFIGIHCLEQLMRLSDAEVVCLVRATATESAYQRLYDNWCWYFEAEQWERYQDRVKVIESDLVMPNFGLDENSYKALQSSVDAVYHLAADTRLVGSLQQFQQANIVPLKQIIDFTRHGKLKDLHYMSTLAVCGVCKEQTRFRESSLNIGQEFQNGYEKTKYEAEEIVNSHIIDGYPAFIYRTGNVSGNSLTGKFQRNSSANRLIQFLNATAKLGVLPTHIDEQVNLSPVDVVASCVIKLSLQQRQKSGVFHVDTPHYFPIKSLYQALVKQGFKFNRSTCKSFGELFEAFDGTADSDLALGKLWSSRSPRNVVYDHSETLRKLSLIDCQFEPPTLAWIEQFVAHLIERKAICKSDPNQLHYGQFTRKRIFQYPDYPSDLLKEIA
ncbi:MULTISPECIES: AMP-binding protein [Pseudoalteromonas]|uniref:AMP-binding protein n=1 Tax=Pseudoalteromonas TaxID=53246 RepID=UPI00110A06E9|nr:MULTISPECIES: AMP-binding protein [Pseudoalteromonas]MCG9760810.1 AMP-binding protein [Pseudoalteromonas sp. Isolate6]NKC17341.1 AMP-binding protein [Pseudoalteromonas galatheae]